MPRIRIFGTFGLRRTLGTLAGHRRVRNPGGLWGCLSIVAWPRFYGRKYLGEINGVFMGAQVFASAIGPLLFGAAESLSGSYDQAAWISIVGNFLLLLGATKAVSYYRPSNP